MATLIGRDLEIQALTDQLAMRDVRLVTLIGPGGIGKTRLAMHVARGVIASDATRVVIVELAGADPDDPVVPAVADSMGVTAAPGGDIAAAVAAAMAGAPTLLVLDNLEHVHDARAAVADLLERSPELTVLATSRVALRIAHERVTRLAPLGSVDAEHSVEHGPAVALFVDVLSSTRGDLAVTPSDLATIADVCRELGGLPLAIELAAGRCAVMTPAELLDAIRSHGPVRALDRGPAKVPSRHHDLGSTIRWSLGLVNAAGRHVLHVAATFTGWSTQAEITTIACATSELSPPAAMDALAELVTHHLVETRSVDDHMSLRLHPAVRAAIVDEPGTRTDALLVEHDAQAVGFARCATAAFDRSDERWWLDALDRRHDDLAAALQRALRRDDPEGSAALVLGLAQLWHQRGRADQHLRVVDQLLDAASAERLSAADRSGLLAWRANVLAEWGGPATDVRELGLDMVDAVRLAVDSGDRDAIMRATLLSARSAPLIGHHGIALEHAACGLETAIAAGAVHVVARFQVMSALLAGAAGALDDAARLATAGLLAARRLDAHAVAATATLLLVQLPVGGEVVDPPPDISDALRSAEVAGDRRTLAIGYVVLARQSLATGDHRSAAAACGSAIRHAVAMGHSNAARMAMVNLVISAVAQGHLRAAATLHGGVADHIDGLRVMFEVARYRSVIVSVEAQLGPVAFDVAADIGRTLQWPDLVGFALACAESWATAPAPNTDALGPSTGSPRPLTRRELEVLRALASGMSNKQIAFALGISLKTAMHHTGNIYDKLGVRGRAAATAWAYRNDLVRT